MILLERRISAAPREADSMGAGAAQQSIKVRDVAGVCAPTSAFAPPLHRLLQFLVDPPLPAGAVLLEGIEDLLVEAKRDLDLGMFQRRAAAFAQFLDCFDELRIQLAQRTHAAQLLVRQRRTVGVFYRVLGIVVRIKTLPFHICAFLSYLLFER